MLNNPIELRRRCQNNYKKIKENCSSLHGSVARID
jgi:hypothetical protein